MSRIVLDASVLLAILNGEPGAERFSSSGLLESAAISAVNVGEAYSKLVSVGIDSEDAWEAVTAPVSDIVAYDLDQAQMTGRLIQLTRSLRLSLGDRACLSLGISLKAPIYTADRAWRDLKVGTPVHVIRL